MARDITQRQVRNDSGEIMRGLDRGETFVVTRHGVPVGELTPLRRHRFVECRHRRRRVPGRAECGLGTAPQRPRQRRIAGPHPTCLIRNGLTGVSSTPRWSSTSNSSRSTGFPWSSPSARSPWQNSPPLHTRPMTPTSGGAGRTGYNGQKQRSIPSPSTEKRPAPMGGSTPPKSRAGARREALERWISSSRQQPVPPDSLYTRNPHDFLNLHGLVDVVAV